jgi:putative flippase GtrA
MALTSNRLGETIAAFATTEIVFTICAGPLALSATWATLLGWLAGALVSYILSRWAWKRKGRPNLLKETLPFWVVSAMVIVVLTLATKFGYHSATWIHLRGAERVLYLDAIYGVANLGTFVLRFLFFHYVLFAGSAGRPAPAVSEEALASTDPGPEPFARTATPEDVPDPGRPADPDRER